MVNENNEVMTVEQAIQVKELDLELRKEYNRPKNIKWIIFGICFCVITFCATITFMYWKLLNVVENSETTTTTTFSANADGNNNAFVQDIK